MKRRAKGDKVTTQRNTLDTLKRFCESTSYRSEEEDRVYSQCSENGRNNNTVGLNWPFS